MTPVFASLILLKLNLAAGSLEISYFKILASLEEESRLTADYSF